MPERRGGERGEGGGGGDFRKVHSMSIKINEIKVLKS